jgi:hypothetical protein
MSPSSEEPQEAVGGPSPAAPEVVAPKAETNVSPPPAPTPPTPPRREPIPDPPKHMLLYTVFGFLCIGVALWLVLAWAGYKEKYTQQTEGWHLGSTKMIEVTLIRDDKKNLACASEKTFGSIHCGYHSNAESWGTSVETDPNVLQPFNTVKNELFLAAGLWQSPILRGTLPAERFTVVCNYHVVGVLKAVSLRWSPTGNFSPVEQSVAVGNLTDCTIPQ